MCSPQNTTKYYDLKIHVRELFLHDHPLMSKEDMLCVEIERDYEEYQRRRAINLIKYYTTRLGTSSLRRGGMSYYCISVQSCCHAFAVLCRRQTRCAPCRAISSSSWSAFAGSRRLCRQTLRRLPLL